MNELRFLRRKKEYLQLKKFDEKGQRERSKFFLTLLFFSSVVFCLIGVRLFKMQIIEYEKYKIKAENNRFRSIKLQPLRGTILDHAGRPLATVRPAFNLVFYREGPFKRQIDVLSRLSDITGIELPVLQAKVLEANKKGLPRYMPVVLLRDINWDLLSRIEAKLHRLPGLDVTIVPKRRYPQGHIAPHLIGYIDEVSLDDLKNGRFPFARPGDLVGKSGVEFVYEEALRGTPGLKRVEIDAKGRLVRVLDTVPPRPGDELYLTIDSTVQKAALNALGDEIGAVVALEPKTGRILCLVSTPGFDPGLFIKSLSTEEWKKLNDKVKRPLMNKAIQGAYPPGSIFKIVMALGALQEGAITPTTTYQCNGYFRLGRRLFRCWDWRGHGETNLYKAIVESCDVYFYQVSLKMGIDKISHYARLFGLGEQTGINLPGEKAGLVPTREWKKRVFKEPWQKGETLNVGIGQGFLTVTPLQAANLIASVANGGTLFQPTYIEEIRTQRGKVKQRFNPVIKARLPIRKIYFSTVKKALVGVVEDRKGTGRASKIEGVKVGGKTGTAQIIRQKKRIKSEKLPWEYRDHAWFVAFAPSDDPGIAVAVIVEHGGHGGSVAAPIARKVIEAWLNTRSPHPMLLPGRTL